MLGQASDFCNVVADAMFWSGTAETGYVAVVDKSGGFYTDLVEIVYNDETLACVDARLPLVFAELVSTATAQVEGLVLRAAFNHWKKPQVLSNKPGEHRFMSDVSFVMERESSPGWFSLSCTSYTIRIVEGVELPVMGVESVHDYSLVELEALFPGFEMRWLAAENLEIDVGEPEGARFVLGMIASSEPESVVMPDTFLQL